MVQLIMNLKTVCSCPFMPVAVQHLFYVRALVVIDQHPWHLFWMFGFGKLCCTCTTIWAICRLCSIPTCAHCSHWLCPCAGIFLTFHFSKPSFYAAVFRHLLICVCNLLHQFFELLVHGEKLLVFPLSWDLVSLSWVSCLYILHGHEYWERKVGDYTAFLENVEWLYTEYKRQPTMQHSVHWKSWGGC